MAALYRVEDQLDGWALQFKEHAACAAGHHPYDLPNCMAALLRPGANLTLAIMLTYSVSPSIWSWRTPAQNGKLKWLVMPRAKPHDRSDREMYIRDSVRVRAEFDFDKASRAFSAEFSDHEILLLPGQCLRVLSLTWDGTYHTCVVEQC